MKFCHIFLMSCLAGLSATVSAEARVAHLTSPDGSIHLSVSDEEKPTITYSVAVDGDTVLAPSPFALHLRGVKEASRIRKANTHRGISEHIEAPFYRQSEFDVDYNIMNVVLDNGVTLEWRVFDDGIAYRYKTALSDTVIVDGETAVFNAAGDPTVYLSHSTNKDNPMAMAFQNQYSVTPLSQADELLAFLPATIDAGKGVKLTILESDLKSYPGMFLKADTTNRSLEGQFAKHPRDYAYYPWRHQAYVTKTEDYIDRTPGTRSFPWRVIAITRRDIDMPVNNLVYALAEPSRVEDTDWIKPGKVAWDWWNDWGLTGVPFEAGINTETYKHYIDFASKNGIEYVVLDEGWYDPKSGDMLTVIDDMDLQELIDYGKSRNVDIVLWTVFNVLDDCLEEACQKYAAMGIKGFKVDFLDRDDQTAIDMTYHIADACARHHLFLDYHGIYKPTGLQRTYPNVLNFEGVFGLEEVKWGDPATDFPRYDVTYPYIRLMAGQCDFTPGAMANATKTDWRAVYSHPMSMGTRSHQISNYIITDSPFTMLCDSPSNYEKEQECVDFITRLPVVFDETRVIDGEIGEYIVTARRHGDNWYIGGATNWTPRNLSIDFSWLPSDVDYKATILADGPNAHKSATDYSLSTEVVNATATKDLHLAPGGGFVIILEPVH